MNPNEVERWNEKRKDALNGHELLPMVKYTSTTQSKEAHHKH